MNITTERNVLGRRQVIRDIVHYGWKKGENLGYLGYLFVRKGDRVRAIITHMGTEYVGKVISVERRFGLWNHGTTPLVPLVILLSDDGKKEQFDNGYVVEVLERGNYGQRPRNIFAEWSLEGRESFVDSIGKSVLCGSLDNLAFFFLAKMNTLLECPIDYCMLGKFFYDQGRPGFVGSSFDVISVRKKSFGKWVRINAQKICLTVAQVHSQETRINMEHEQDLELY